MYYRNTGVDPWDGRRMIWGNPTLFPPLFSCLMLCFIALFQIWKSRMERGGGVGGMQPYSSPLNLPMTWSELLLVRDCYICRHGEGVYQGIHDRHKLVAFPVKGVYVINNLVNSWQTLRHTSFMSREYNNDFKIFYTWTCFKRILDLNGYLDMKPFQMPLLTNGNIK